MSAKSLGSLSWGRVAQGSRADWRQRERLLGLLLMLPASVLIFGLILYPLVYDLALSLSDSSLSDQGQFVGLANFAQLLGHFEFWVAARNSAIYTLLGSLAAAWGSGLALRSRGWCVRTRSRYD